MNRDHQPCKSCSKFVPGKAETGYCTGYERAAQANDPPCVLFTEMGAWATRQSLQPPKFK